MSESSPESESGAESAGTSAPDRLGGAGIGSILGGLALGVASLPFTYTSAATVVCSVAIATWIVTRRRRGRPGIALGIGAVGAIALVEATSAAGLGLGPLALSGIAVAVGTFDVLAGAVLGEVRERIS